MRLRIQKVKNVSDLEKKKRKTRNKHKIKKQRMVTRSWVHLCHMEEACLTFSIDKFDRKSCGVSLFNFYTSIFFNNPTSLLRRPLACLPNESNTSPGEKQKDGKNKANPNEKRVVAQEYQSSHSLISIKLSFTTN